MKYKLAITLTLALALTVSGLLYIFNNNKKTNQPIAEKEKVSITNKPPIKEYIYNTTIYFVVVTNIKSKLINILSDDLDKKTISVLNSDNDSLKKIDLLKNTELEQYTDLEKLYNKLKTKPDSLAIINVDQLDYRFKSLSLDNQFLFDKNTDLNLYRLKFSEKKVSTNPQKKDETNYSHEKLTKLGHTGSMLPARGVTYWIDNSWGGDYKHLFESTKPIFDKFDLLSSTFESPVLGSGQQCDSCFSFIGPEKFMDGVEYSGIDFFTMASNHIMDGGVQGLQNTMKKLDELGIEYVGASTLNNDDATKPVIVEANRIKIAYIGLNDTPGFETWARDNKPGAGSISDPVYNSEGSLIDYKPNEERIKSILQRAKDLKPDKVIVLMHWGHKEYEATPLPSTKVIADLLTKNGADLILGDHPHWVQNIEIVNDKPVFYSVGNFIFDQMWSIETRQGMTIELNFIDNKLVNFRLHPHELYLYDKGMPVLLKPEDPGYQQTLDRVFEGTDF